MENVKRTKGKDQNSLGGHVSRDARRRQMKPITERIRRERINNSLYQLKSLVLNAMNKDVLQYAKMEKADILDMAVKYIKCLQTVKQESQDGCHEPQEGNPASHVSPADNTSTDITDGSGQTIQNHSSRTYNINHVESSFSEMLSLVQPEIHQKFPTSVTMETQIIHTSSPMNTDYVPSSSFSNVQHRANMTTTWCNNTNKSPSLYLTSSKENLSAICKVRAPLTDKKQNILSTENYGENATTMDEEKGQHRSTEKKNIRLPGMECFVRDNYMAERFKINKENQTFDGYSLGTNQQRELQIDFDSSQYSLPLWRPW